MKDWFLSLTQRERTMVQVAASVVAVFMSRTGCGKLPGTVFTLAAQT